MSFFWDRVLCPECEHHRTPVSLFPAAYEQLVELVPFISCVLALSFVPSSSFEPSGTICRLHSVSLLTFPFGSIAYLISVLLHS